MIQSFKDKTTAVVAQGKCPKGFPSDLVNVSVRKLNQLHRATGLDSLREPPGNRLEILMGDRAGQYSIRINDQWRICFEWHDGHAWNVEITDYH
jgi:proteic killer suppression protein